MYLEFFLASSQIPQKISPRGFPPRPCLRAGGIQNPCRISETLVSVLRTILPENCFRKTESIFSERLISSHLSRSVDCVPRFSPLEKLCITQACIARARHAGDF